MGHRAGGALGALLLAATVLAPGAVRAGERARTPPERKRSDATIASPEGTGFYRVHLLPGLTRQFEVLAPYEALPVRPERQAGRFVFEGAAREAKRRARRGTERALKEFLLASTPVGRWIDRVELKRSRSESGETARASRVGLAFRHGRPVVELRRQLGRGQFRAGLGVDGRVRLEYRDDLFVGGGLRVDYDPGRRELNLACRIGF
jgi:hypothetical protein